MLRVESVVMLMDITSLAHFVFDNNINSTFMEIFLFFVYSNTFNNAI